MIPSSNDTFIYLAMDPHAGYRIINKQISLKNQLKQTNYVVWLPRVSNQSEEMVTIDCAFFEKNAWKNSSIRFLLSENGWILAHDKKILADFKPVSTEIANKYKDQFYLAINKGVSEHLQKELILDEKYRVNPEISLRSTNELLSGYHGTFHRIQLTPDVEQAITCDLTGEYFQEPVIMLKTMQNIKASDGKHYTLYEGRSYDKSALEQANISCDFYQPNEALKQITSKISPLSQMELSLLAEEHLEDPVSLLWNDASNRNVCNFVQAWPRFKGFLQEHLKSQIEILIEEKDLKRKREYNPLDDEKNPKQLCMEKTI